MERFPAYAGECCAKGRSVLAGDTQSSDRLRHLQYALWLDNALLQPSARAYAGC
jgi:hypothetical protein